MRQQTLPGADEPRHSGGSHPVTTSDLDDSVIVRAEDQHLAWIARRFGRSDYLPLSTADLAVLTVVGVAIERRAGGHLFLEGDPADAAFVVEDGEVELYRGRGPGRRIVARVGTGHVVGDIAMFCGVPYHSSAVAATDATLVAFSRKRILPALARHPAIGLRWLVAALTQLERTQRHVVCLLHRTVRARLAALLLEEADERGYVALSQHVMAQLLGVSRQSVNEALAELRARSAVATGYGFVRVLDLQALEVARDKG